MFLIFFQNKVAAAAAAVAALDTVDESESRQVSVQAVPAKQKRPAAAYQEQRQGKTFQVWKKC
jgi:hypothetical protein